jgi:asparagine synthase (glutamine-hydrolysing)
MCGFIYTTQKFGESDEIWESAKQSIICRGPDQQGQHLSESGSFSHSRLCIIGSNVSGRQPFNSESSESTLVFNGEIYNYRELANLLEIEADSDTQVLFEILNQGRLDLLKNLRGIFSFVFVSPITNRLLVLRDQYGVKPLYFSEKSGDLVFSSVLAPILFLNGKSELDKEAIERFLATGTFQSGKTMIKSAIEISPGVLETWELQGRNHVSSEQINYSPISISEHSDKNLLLDAVRANLTSDVPIGLMLSGGIDSTLLAVLALQGGKALDCFTLTNPEDGSINEANFAKINSENLGLRLTAVPINYSRLDDHLEMIIKTSGEPFGDPAFLLLRELSKKIALTHKTVLAGEGADELFGGYARYKIGSFRSSLIGKIIKNLNLSRYTKVPSLTSSKPRRILYSILVKEDFDSHSGLLGHNWELASSLLSSTPGHLKNLELLKWKEDLPSPIGYPYSSARKFDLENTLTGTYLKKSDRASMSVGLEVRVPFLDQEILNSLRNGKGEEIGKRSLKLELIRLFPEVQLPKQKMGLSVNIQKILNEVSDDQTLDNFIQFFHLVQPKKETINDLRARIKEDPFLAFRLETLVRCVSYWEDFLVLS